MPKIAAIPASRLRKIFEKDGFKCVKHFSTIVS